jgi:hypothetical protein
MFRLQRFGVATARLLAVGQRHPLPWRTESFLLTEAPGQSMSLAGWLARQAGRPLWTAEGKQRRQWLRDAGQMLRRMHEAGYCGNEFTDHHFLIQSQGSGQPLAGPAIVLGTLQGIHSRTRSRSIWRNRDLRALQTAFAPLLNSRTDQVRFLLGYLGLSCLTPDSKRLIKGINGGKGKRTEKAYRPAVRLPRFPSSYQAGPKRAAS